MYNKYSKLSGNTKEVEPMKQLGEIKYSYDSKYLYHKGRKNNHNIYINFCVEENKKFVRIYHPDNSIKVFYWFNNTLDAVKFVDNYINHNIVPSDIMVEIEK